MNELDEFDVLHFPFIFRGWIIHPVSFLILLESYGDTAKPLYQKALHEALCLETCQIRQALSPGSVSTKRI